MSWLDSLADVPDALVERVRMAEGILIACATGGSSDNHIYERLRREFVNDPAIRDLLPSFVRTYRNLDAFWPFIKDQAGTYAERRQLISNAFTPLIDHLEGRFAAPSDTNASEALRSFDSDGVHAVWAKALERRNGGSPLTPSEWPGSLPTKTFTRPPVGKPKSSAASLRWTRL